MSDQVGESSAARGAGAIHPPSATSPSTGLVTDLYQLTMAQGYHHHGLAEQEAVFHLFFRTLPFQGGYAICAGLETVLEELAAFRFDAEDIAYLRSLRTASGSPLFSEGFLSYLRELRFTCDVDAMPEGTACFPHEPLLRVRGPLIQAQLVETMLLNSINFQTLVATKASRIASAAGKSPVLEFGLRRAQGPDGGLSASRAAYIGGCAATSNVLAGRRFGIPVRGTHAHSWVMCFDQELDAFERYAESMPDNCIFLVDTYDTLQGVDHAIRVGLDLRQRGHRMLGIRLDSGDLTTLSIEARKRLDATGLNDAAIVASDDLDEYRIAELERKGAKISVWGVGTRLVTAFDQPALGGVYKLAALRPDARSDWQFKLKLSEVPIKTSIAGVLDVARFELDGQVCLDLLYDAGLSEAPKSSRDRVSPWSGTRLHSEQRLDPPRSATWRSLLEPVLRGGARVGAPEPLDQIRERALAEVRRLPLSARQHSNTATPVAVGMEAELQRMNQRLRTEALDKQKAR